MSRESGAGPERNGNGGGLSGNTGRGSGSNGSSSGSGKGGGKNDSGGSSKKGSSKSSSSSSKNDKMGGKQSSSQSTGYSSMGGASSYGMDKGSFANSIGANNEGKQAGKGGGKNDSGTLSQRVKSIASATQAIATRSQVAPVSNAHQISSLGGASMYGMAEDAKGLLGRLAEKVGLAADTPDTGFNQTINTDNVNGVIRNWGGKEKNGTLTATDRQHIAQMAGGFNKQAGLNLAGYGLLGSLGGAAAKKVGELTAPGDYFSGTGRRIANGQFDGSRLEGSENDVLGRGGGLDDALKSALGLVSSFVPGLGYLTDVVGAGLTQPAAGTGTVLNGLAGNKTAGPTSGDGGSRDYAAPARPSIPKNSTDGTLDENYRYDPTKYQFNKGARAATPWSYN
ncbi:hypothetical protein [Aeromonas hydrophila]|uniref:hypothetical protein n=1 Tax=Aeromonas hydrophila TaxID=644 RepID=UPI00259E7CAC|nr:hypothetical protein [Aeromonas hydrophila]MDM5117186.1 hypothetical protein [Aeromonas hydrophila]